MLPGIKSLGIKIKTLKQFLSSFLCKNKLIDHLIVAVCLVRIT